MLWLMRFSIFFSAAMALVVLSPSLQSFPPAKAIKSSTSRDISVCQSRCPPRIVKTYFRSGKPLHSAMPITVVRIKGGFQGK
ncbi:hypothetical protein QN277_025852 [Acacia crassicarpa]|uniref:Secreted protein n=1 Tax=Acacia crassicarpa TaxID=499986 RepID=A0AAE1MLC2_9FABA|nr:hypothetical protein QN277_025852 [Acacia crassicarpa]